jgi:c-di-GMP-related signal transduction protein
MRSQDLLRTSVALIQNELKRKDSNVKKRNKESGSPSSACSSLDNKTSKTFENLSSRDLLQGDAKLLPDCFTQLTKDLTKRKNTQKNINQIKKFKKVQYEDFMDDCTAELIADKLAMLNYDSGMVSFDFSVLATSQQYGIESYYIEWVPENM